MSPAGAINLAFQRFTSKQVSKVNVFVDTRWRRQDIRRSVQGHFRASNRAPLSSSFFPVYQLPRTEGSTSHSPFADRSRMEITFSTLPDPFHPLAPRIPGGGRRGGSESFETFYNPSRGPCLKTCHRNCVNFTSGGARKERIIRNQQ